MKCCSWIRYNEPYNLHSILGTYMVKGMNQLLKIVLLWPQAHHDIHICEYSLIHTNSHTNTSNTCKKKIRWLIALSPLMFWNIPSCLSNKMLFCYFLCDSLHSEILPFLFRQLKEMIIDWPI